MKRRSTIPALVLMGFAPVLHAGVVMDMVTRDAAGQETDRSQIFAQSGILRVNGGAGGESSNVSMIFLGEEFLVLDHAEKSYIVMDEAMLDQLTSSMSGAMQQIEAELANLPPEQRAMAEQMMKGQMQSMMGQQAGSAAKPRVEAVGNGQWQGNSCTNYAVYEGGQKTQLVCATSLDHIGGMDEMTLAFERMAQFVRKLTEALPIPIGDSMSPGEIMDQIDGFPVQRTLYLNGEVTGEYSLESLTEKELDDSLFAAPDDYKRTDPFKGR